MNRRHIMGFLVATASFTALVTGCSAAPDDAAAAETEGVAHAEEALTDGGTDATAPQTTSRWTYGDGGADAGDAGNLYNVDSRIVILRESKAETQVYGHYWDFRNEASSGAYLALEKGITLPDGGADAGADGGDGGADAGTGKAAVFAMWNAVSASPGSGATCAAWTSGGTGQTCELPYAWVAGHTYRLRTWVLSGETWGAWVLDETTGVESFVGEITAPAQNGWITASANFTQDVTPIQTCSDVPYSRVQYHRPTGNDGNVTATTPTDFESAGSCTDDSIEYDSYQTSVFHSIGNLPCGGIADDQGIHAGQSVSSCDGRFHLRMQTDGNLVLTMNGVGPLWSSRTSGTRGNYAVMQSDGNFVVYGGAALWSAGTYGHPGARLAVQNDGNVVIYKGSTALWSSGTSGH